MFDFYELKETVILFPILFFYCYNLTFFNCRHWRERHEKYVQRKEKMNKIHKVLPEVKDRSIHARC